MIEILRIFYYVIGFSIVVFLYFFLKNLESKKETKKQLEYFLTLIKKTKKSRKQLPTNYNTKEEQLDCLYFIIDFYYKNEEEFNGGIFYKLQQCSRFINIHHDAIEMMRDILDGSKGYSAKELIDKVDIYGSVKDGNVSK